MTLDPKRVGSGYRSAPAPSRGLSDRRITANEQVPPEFQLGAGLAFDRRRRISVSVGPGLTVRSDGTIQIDMAYIRAQLAQE